MDKYKQCVLKRGNITTTSWIPEKYAKVNKPLKLKEQGEWSDGWIVQSVGSLSVPKDQVIERSQDYKHHREATDI